MRLRRPYVTEYNGWTNRNTWTVALWLGNDPDTERYAKLRAKQSPKTLQCSISSGLTRGLIGLALDLMTNALEDVNWREIAVALLEDGEEAENRGSRINAKAF